MGSLPPTAFDTLMQQLGTLPLWVKQVIYAQLRYEMEALMSRTTLEAFGPEHTMQLWVPEITRGGLAESERPTGQYDQNMLRLLHLVRYQKNVVQITVLSNWSLEQCSKVLMHAIDAELVGPPRSMIVRATIDYLAGQTRLGEYLVKINRLSIEQLDQALRTQKYIEESMGERTGIANVLINLGYIKKEDSEGILFLKQESRKAFEGLQMGPGSNITPETVTRLQHQLHQAIQRIRELEATNYQLQQQQKQRP